MPEPRPACPNCGQALDLNSYSSMMLLSREQALFTVECPSCAETVTSVELIPPSLYEEIESAARKVHAGMGAPTRNNDQPSQE